MKQGDWLLRLAVLVAPTMFSSFATAADELVPYTDDMTQGQGFNTFLRQGCVHDAVQVTQDPKSSDGPVEVTYSAQRMTSYEKFVNSLDISAGGTITGVQNSGSFNARFLDKNTFETSFLTYLVKVDIRRQPTSKKSFKFKPTGSKDADKTYCDRFISDFVKGGALYARVSIITTDKTKHQEVEQDAKVAFNAYGVDSEVTNKVKASLDRIQKNSQVLVYLHYVGAPPGAKKTIKGGKDDELLQLKGHADAFLADAKKHDWKRFAMLERYTNIPGFNEFTPLDYSGAIDRSWSVFLDYNSYMGIQGMIRQIPEDKYIGDRQKRGELDDHSSNVLEAYRTWITGVSTSPDKAKTKPEIDDPSLFRAQVVLAVQTTRYIGQRIYLRNGGSTDVIDKTLKSQARKLFEIDAYDFSKLLGTVNLVFAKNPNSEQHEVVTGRAASPGYETVCELWVFAKPVSNVVNATVDVSLIPQGPVIELDYHAQSAKAPTRRALPSTLLGRWSRVFGRQNLPLFSFYVKPT